MQTTMTRDCVRNKYCIKICKDLKREDIFVLIFVSSGLLADVSKRKQNSASVQFSIGTLCIQVAILTIYTICVFNAYVCLTAFMYLAS